MTKSVHFLILVVFLVSRITAISLKAEEMEPAKTDAANVKFAVTNFATRHSSNTTASRTKRGSSEGNTTSHRVESPVEHKCPRIRFVIESATYNSKSVTDDSKSVTDDPKSITDDPKSVTDDPKSITDDPKSVTDDPKSVTNDPKSVTDDPKSTPSESCEVVRTVKEVNDNVENLERTVKCTCKTGMIAGTTREKPACVPATIFDNSQWCDMNPCLENEKCQVLEDLSGWSCDNGVQTKKVVVKSEKKQLTAESKLP